MTYNVLSRTLSDQPTDQPYRSIVVITVDQLLKPMCLLTFNLIVLLLFLVFGLLHFGT